MKSPILDPLRSPNGAVQVAKASERQREKDGTPHLELVTHMELRASVLYKHAKRVRESA